MRQFPRANQSVHGRGRASPSRSARFEREEIAEAPDGMIRQRASRMPLDGRESGDCQQSMT
eukprot:6214029-Pleurochrysis_carterae.AAC.2